MATINVATFSHAIWPGIKEWFGTSYDEYPTEYTEIFNVMNSNQNFERDVGYYGIGLASVKPEGQPMTFDDLGQGFKKDYTHVVYANGYIMTRESMEDNLYSKLAKAKSRSLAFAMRQSKEIICANVLNNAFTTETSADGVALCSTSHLLYKGGTEANKLSVDLPFSEAAVEEMTVDMSKTLDDAGLTIKVLPKKLVIPTDLQYEVKRVLKSPLRSGTADNDLNAVSDVFPGGVCVNHFLSSATAYFMLTDCENGFKLYQKRAIELVNDTPDFESEIMKVKSSERYSVGCTDFRAVYGSDGV